MDYKILGKGNKSSMKKPTKIYFSTNVKSVAILIREAKFPGKLIVEKPTGVFVIVDKTKR